MHMTAIRSLAVWCLFGLAGCALVQEVSKTPRTATEQLLLSHAIEQALAHLALPLPQDTSVFLEVSGLQTDRAQLHLDEQNDKLGVIDNPSWDLAFVRDLVAGRLGELGYRIQTRTNEEVTHVVRVLVQAIGTNQGKTFFGMPPIQSVLIPFSLPQLTLYQELSQLAHARFHVQISEKTTGRYVDATPMLRGNAYYNQYTVLFFFTFKSTDLIAPP
jgi:hypothetical protein